MSNQLSFSAREPVFKAKEIYLDNINSVLFVNNGNVAAVLDGNFLLKPGATFQAGLQNDLNFISQKVKIDFIGASFPSGFAPVPSPDNPEPRIDIMEFRLDECEASKRLPN